MALRQLPVRKWLAIGEGLDPEAKYTSSAAPRQEASMARCSKNGSAMSTIRQSRSCRVVPLLGAGSGPVGASTSEEETK